MAALFLAVDPWLLSASRSADSAILSIALGLLLGVGLIRWPGLSVTERRLLAVVVGLFLLSGPLAWLLLPVLALTVWQFRPDFSDVASDERRTLLLILGGTLLLVGTSFFTAWEGVGLISTSVSTALAYVSQRSDYPALWPWMRLVVDQPLLVVGVLCALVWVVVRGRAQSMDRRWLWLLGTWLIYGALLMLLPARNPSTLLILGLPLLLITARIASEIVRFAMQLAHWQDGLLIALTLAVLMVTAGFLAAFLLREAERNQLDQRIFLFYLTIPLVVAFFAWWADGRTTAQVTGLMLLALFFAANLSSSWMMNLRSEMVRGNALSAVTAHSGLRALARDVAKLGSIRSGDPGVMPVRVAVDPDLRPLVGWYLRFVQDLRFEGAIDGTSIDLNSLLVTSQQPTVLPAGLVGSDYPVVTVWLPFDLTDRLDQIGWLLYRDLDELPTTRSLFLWGPVSQ